MPPTWIAHLSDCHIGPPGWLWKDRVDTAMALRRALQRLSALQPSPHALVLTGDLVESGGDEEYEHLAGLLACWDGPVYLMPGNHDDREALRRAFPSHAHLGKSGFIHYSARVGDVRLIVLDTLEAGRPWGRLCPLRLAWLEFQLERFRDDRVVLALHHPPCATGLAAMDPMGLTQGAEELLTMLEHNPQVERVLCGHLHRSIVTVMGPAVVCVAPGTAHQIHLSPAVDAPLAWTLEPGGFLLHRAAPDAPITTHQVFSGPFEGPFPYGD